MRKILLLIDCSSEYDRRLLRGLVRYSKEHEPWLFYRMPSSLMGNLERGQSVIDWAQEWKADAIVGRWRWSDTDKLALLSIPIVLQNYTSRSEIFSNITGDYIGTGALAARFFINQHYTSYAYFGVRDIIWSEERLLGFAREINKESGRTLQSLMVSDTSKERGKIVKWLKSLPKPTAVFSCDDEYALFLSEACKYEGISIPEDISLLSVDNDELLCEISDPQISSIELNVEQGGYRLGQMLDQRFRNPGMKPFNIVISPGEIVTRRSTKTHNIKDPMVKALVDYIDDYFDQGLSTDKILSNIPLSRRSLEIRFKREMDSMTIYGYLTKKRMEKMAELLATTSLPVIEIAGICGIADCQNVSRVFKKIYSCTPKEYRAKHKKA